MDGYCIFFLLSICTQHVKQSLQGLISLIKRGLETSQWFSKNRLMVEHLEVSAIISSSQSITTRVIVSQTLTVNMIMSVVLVLYKNSFPNVLVGRLKVVYICGSQFQIIKWCIIIDKQTFHLSLSHSTQLSKEK